MPRLLSLTLLLCACGGASDPEAEAYLNQLPDIAAPPPPHNRAVAPAQFEYQDSQVCSTTTYSIGDAPEEVVMFNADPQVFWPGALIQGDSYTTGSPLLLPLEDRATLNLSISGLYAGETAAFDVTPTQSSVLQAMNELLNGAVRDETPSTQSVFFKQEEAYSFEQSALELGFSANYLGAKVSGGLAYETSAEVNTIVANATIRTFTISVDQPPTPSAFFEGLKKRSIDEQIELGRMSEFNLPVYVASVTYGQIMMFSASSTASMTDLKAALSASFNSFAGGASAGLTAEQQQVLQGSTLQVVTLGGSEEGVADMIRNGDPADFFQGSTAVTSSVPIGYTLKDLHGNIVKVGETAEYGLTTCSPNGFANFYVLNQGGDGFTSGYYADGSRADLGNDAMGSASALDIVHDALTDRIYVMDVEWGQRLYVDVYASNGMRPTDPLGNGGYDFTIDGGEALTYDPVNARLYAVGSMNGRAKDVALASAWSTDGASLDLLFEADVPPDYATLIGRAAVYDEQRDLLLIATFVNGFPGNHGDVYAFDKRGNPVELAGDFPDLGEPEGIALDPNLGRIYVSDIYGDVHVYDLEGRPIELLNPITGLGGPRDLHFDATYNRLYVLETDASLISVFEPDGTEAEGLATPQFPGLNQPTGMTWRPQ